MITSKITTADQFNPHAISKEEVLKKFNSSLSGLTNQKSTELLIKHGPNSIQKKRTNRAIKILINQCKNLFFILLTIAAIFSIIFHDIIDGLAIIAIIIINTILGFVQEYRAEKAIESLKKQEIFSSNVIRNNKLTNILAREVVPGDIIVVSAGDKISADARIIESYDLEVDESLLTGESTGVLKEESILLANNTIADRTNLIYSGTMVIRGRCKAVVYSTGMSSEIGQIATDIQETKEKLTPLQIALNHLGKILAIFSLILALPLIPFGILVGNDLIDMILSFISLIVSAVPEGLPVVVAITLALGVKRMAKSKVLIRKLSSAETLGSTDVICSDKTGTITHNQMTVAECYVHQNGFFSVTGEGYKTVGEFSANNTLNTKFNLTNNSFTKSKSAVEDSFKAMVLCSDSTIDQGDPTERALFVAAAKLKIDSSELSKKYKRVNETPFNSKNKYMSVSVNNSDKLTQMVKGAPEVILDFCNLNSKDKELILNIVNEFAARGLRTLAVAKKQISSKKNAKLKNLCFLALVGISDPPRKNVAKSLGVCKKAGIRVIMITGDHQQTAKAVAEKIGLETPQVITGAAIDLLDNASFLAVVEKVNVFARVSPKHKVKILEALQKLGHQVAMTGDGVNDAASIKKANIGIAVGSATHLTKEVSDMILLDDNFNNIPKAIHEGRKIFFNIKKFVKFLLAANFDEIFETLAALLLGVPLPFLPIHILWVNLATDSLPALAIARSDSDENLMSLKPYKPQKEILRGVLSFSIIAGIIDFFASFGLYLTALYILDLPIVYARTMNLTSAVLFELFLVFSIITNKSLFTSKIYKNYFLIFAVIITLLAHVLIVYHPLGNLIFKTTPLMLKDWLIILAVSSSGIIFFEGKKLLKKKA